MTERSANSESRLAPYWSIIDQGIVSAGAFLTIVICARQIPAEELGKLAYAIAAYGAALLLNSALLFQPASVSAPVAGQRARFRANLARVQLPSSVLAAAVFTLVLFGLPVAYVGELRWVELLAVFTYLLLQQLSEYDRRISYITATPRRAAASSASNYLIRVALLIALLDGTAVSALVLMSIAAVATAAITVRSATTATTEAGSAIRELRHQASLSRWFLANIPFVYAWGRLPLYLVGSVLGIAAAGMFMTVRSITNVANAGLELIETYFAARLGREFGVDHGQYSRTIAILMVSGFLAWFAGAIVIAYLGEFILDVVSRGQFVHLVSALHLFWAANLAIFLFRVQAVHLRTSRRERAIPFGYLAGIVTTSGLFMGNTVAPSISGMATAILCGAIVVLIVQFLVSKVLVNGRND